MGSKGWQWVCLFSSLVFSTMLTFCGTIAPDEIGDSLDSEEDTDMRRMSMSFSSSFFGGPYIVLNYCFALTGHQPLFCAARQPVIDNLPTHDIGHMNVECPFCHAFHWIDEHVLSSSVDHPEFGTCCDHGKVMLPPLRVPPLALFNLFMESTPAAKEFRKNMVQYNAALAFTSMGVHVDRSVLGRGPPVFRIHGELTHLAGSLLPEEGVRPMYAQLYIYDPEEAYRC